MLSNSIHKFMFSLLSHSLTRLTRQKIADFRKAPSGISGRCSKNTLSQHADSDQGKKKRQTPLAFGLYTKNHHIPDLGMIYDAPGKVHSVRINSIPEICGRLEKVKRKEKKL